MKIFVCIESYLPGTLGGGPVRALVNLIEHLGEEHTFFIFTRNHDYLSADPYAEIQPNVWHRQDRASIYYSDTGQVESSLLEEIKCVQPDWIYLNGALPALTRTFLSLRRTVPSIQKIPVLLAPHGNLSPSALAHHRFRKQGWLLYAKARRLYDNLIWHAASEREADQVRTVFGEAAQIRTVPMAPRAEGTASDTASPRVSGSVKRFAHAIESELPGSTTNHLSRRIEKKAEHATSNEQPTTTNSPLSLVYFGRLSPEKNLPFAFLLLKEFAAQHPDQAVVYDLIGTGEPAYESKLRSLSVKLPSTVQVNFLGQLTPEALQVHLKSPDSQPPSLPEADAQPPTSNQQPTTSRYHALLMPSLTENFSYTVLESLQAGISVLISDQTPWRDLQQQGVGWDLSLEDPDRWLQALEDLLSLSSASDHASDRRSDLARKFASAWGDAYQSKACQLFEQDQTSEELYETP